jgi:hypothetical protein
MATVIRSSVQTGAPGSTDAADRAATLPAPVDNGLASDDEDDPLADTEGDASALQAPDGDKNARYDPDWFKCGPEYFQDVGGGRRAVDWEGYMKEFKPRMPAATKLPWNKEAADYSNFAWADKREWKGPAPGLNLEYWDNLRSVLSATAKSTSKSKKAGSLSSKRKSL